MRLTVCKEFTFAAAHRLPKYDGPCFNLHGHEWKMEVELSGTPDEETGMVLDFVELKKMVNSCLINDLDHKYLNDQFVNPTAENMVIEFVRIIQAFMKTHAEMLDRYILLERIRLYETPTSFAEWKRGACLC